MIMTTPNILLIVSDQERQRDWLPAGLDLPARQRLLDEGLELTFQWFEKNYKSLRK